MTMVTPLTVSWALMARLNRCYASVVQQVVGNACSRVWIEFSNMLLTLLIHISPQFTVYAYKKLGLSFFFFNS